VIPSGDVKQALLKVIIDRPKIFRDSALNRFSSSSAFTKFYKELDLVDLSLGMMRNTRLIKSDATQKKAKYSTLP
jgi:hypothetical protein